MTTDVEALIADLQKKLYGSTSWGDTVLMSRSIDALRSQAEHIQILESSNGHLRDALRAQSDKIQSMALSAISDAERIQALEAKCALLAASLAQAEKAEARYEWLRRRAVMWDASSEASFTLTLLNDEGPTGEFLDDLVDFGIADQAGSKEGE